MWPGQQPAKEIAEVASCPPTPMNVCGNCVRNFALQETKTK
jgi:hypothetical protein